MDTQLLNFTNSLKQLNNTSTQVIHKNDTRLDQDGIYGWAATAKSLVSKAVAQRHKDSWKKSYDLMNDPTPCFVRQKAVQTD